MGTTLVTGGAGFLGSYVVAGLLARGERVVAYDVSLATTVLDRVVPPDARDGLELVQGELTDGWGLLRLCERAPVGRVVHLAAPLTDWVRENPAAGLRAMCGGTAALLEVARALSLERVAWTSSISVYGGSYDARAGSASPRRPESLYGSFKVLCEDLAAAYRSDHGVAVVGLRLPVVYGPWRARGLKASFGQDGDPLREAALGLPVVVSRPGRTLNWLYVEDAADALIQALSAEKPIEPIYDLSGEVASMRRLGELLRELAPEGEITIDESGDGEAELSMAALDDGPFRTDTGWEPQYTFRDGVAATMAAYRDAAAEVPAP